MRNGVHAWPIKERTEKKNSYHAPIIFQPVIIFGYLLFWYYIEEERSTEKLFIKITNIRIDISLFWHVDGILSWHIQRKHI